MDFYELGNWRDIATKAAQWGSDQELEACCEWLEDIGPSGVQLWGDDLRTDRRPKPPTLKEQALRVLHDLPNMDCDHYNIILRALEQLDD